MSTRESSTLEAVGVRASRPLMILGGALFAYALYELIQTGVVHAALFAGAVILSIGLVYLRW